MKIRGHGNGLAIAVSAVAVVFAASGTAYAVTATVVNIADPSTPSRVAKVDAAGRLSTAGATSTLDIAATTYTTSSDNADVYSAPTTATLAVSSFSVVALSQTAPAPYDVYLFQVPVLADGTCSTTTTVRTLAYGTVASGLPGGQTFPAPIVVTPIGTAKYCLDVFFRLSTGSTGGGGRAFGVQLAGYVVSGKYTGTGVAPADSGAAVPKAAAVGGR